eukprot:Mrub_09903.p1 GENE.Mrub_09903~~Mrub_09903.p1  ORF type:complete len:216 (+),score=54.81 Mrub_09903:86-649(+)
MDIEKENRDLFIKLFKDNLNNSKYNPQDHTKMDEVLYIQDRNQSDLLNKSEYKWASTMRDDTQVTEYEEKEFGDDEDEFDDKSDHNADRRDDLSDLPKSEHEADSNCNIYGLYRLHKFNKQKMMKVTLENVILSMNGYEMCFKDVRIFAHWLERPDGIDLQYKDLHMAHLDDNEDNNAVDNKNITYD